MGSIAKILNTNCQILKWKIISNLKLSMNFATCAQPSKTLQILCQNELMLKRPKKLKNICTFCYESQIQKSEKGNNMFDMYSM